MSLSPEQQASILRYYHAERWRVGTIATQLGLHRDTVARVLAQAGLPRLGPILRASAIDPYLPFIHKTLEQFPTLTAARLYGMVRERGYPGRPDHFRHLIARYRPRPASEAYLRLSTLPGEQCQVDWAHFGHLQIGRARRPLMGFVMVLSWSRQIFLRFYLDARMENFLRGHVAAFEQWQGAPRIALYDNLKSAVLERQGNAIRFNPALLALAAHYRVEPLPVAVARGNEKGRVERAIGYVRTAFFAGRTFGGLDDLNAQAQTWADGQASDRKHPQDTRLTVREAFAQEREHLLALPDWPAPTDEIRAVSVGKTPYARFDLNDYSVPHAYVRRTLTVTASAHQVRVLDGQTVLATHARSYDRGQQVEAPGHIAELAAHKARAGAHRGVNRLAAAVPAAAELLRQGAERGEPLARLTRTLEDWLDHYGAAELDAAIADALARGVAHPNAVRRALEQRRLARRAAVPIAVALPEHIKQRDVPVRAHRLEPYDRLMETPDERS
ncbi:MAG: IS21 family transposase [Burkholderiaceae bacterium]|jgi:transposase|nr:IS21 family transposase [Burkholderiaceae bacterium]